MKAVSILTGIMLMVSATLPSAALAQSCASFVDALTPVPHTDLTLRETDRGCGVSLVTDVVTLAGATLPDLQALPGWQYDPASQADGPGITAYTLAQDTTRCRVTVAQPAAIDETGQLVQSETLTVTVKCVDLRPGLAHGEGFGKKP